MSYTGYLGPIAFVIMVVGILAVMAITIPDQWFEPTKSVYDSMSQEEKIQEDVDDVDRQIAEYDSLIMEGWPAYTLEFYRAEDGKYHWRPREGSEKGANDIRHNH